MWEENEMSEEEKKVKKTSKIILILIFVLIIAVIGIICAILYLKSSSFKVTIDGKSAQGVENTFIIDEQTGKVYVDIKAFASYVGYTAHDGEYKVYSQDTNKCYVESANETASFFLNSNKISKVAPDSTEDYEDYTISEPVKRENGKLYIISDGMEKACNLVFSYNKEANSIAIYTLPYLVEQYTQKIIQMGYAGISSDFNNQKAILYDMFVVQEGTAENTSKENAKYGVINLKNEEIIALRYSNIEFSENTRRIFCYK